MVTYFGRNIYDRIMNASILLLLFLAFCYLIWPADYWPIKCIEIKKVEILTPEVKPGDQVVYRITFNKLTDRSAMVSRQILNDRIFNYVDLPSALPRGTDTVTTSIKLPLTATPGQPHKLVWSATYKLPFREVSYRAESPEFMVVGDKK